MAYYNNYNAAGPGPLPYLSGQDRLNQDRRWGPQPLYNLPPNQGRSYGNKVSGGGLAAMPHQNAAMPHHNRGFEPHPQPLQSNKPFPSRRQSITHEFKPNLLQTSRTDNQGGGGGGSHQRSPSSDVNPKVVNPGGFYSRNLPTSYNESRLYNHGGYPFGNSYVGGGFGNHRPNPYHPSINGPRYDDAGRGGRGGGMNVGANRVNQFSFTDAVAERRVEQKGYQNRQPQEAAKQFTPSKPSSREKWWENTNNSSKTPSPVPKPNKTLKLAELERDPATKENDFASKKQSDESKTARNTKPVRGNNDFVAKNESKQTPLNKSKPLNENRKLVGNNELKTKPSRGDETIDGSKKELKSSAVRNTPAREIDKLIAKKELKDTLKKDQEKAASPDRIQEDHLPDTTEDELDDADEMEKLAELERISLRKAVMKQKQIYEDTPADRDKELENQRKFQKSRQKLEESDAIMDAIDEETSDKSEEKPYGEADSEQTGDSRRSSDFTEPQREDSTLNDGESNDDVFEKDKDGDLDEWW